MRFTPICLVLFLLTGCGWFAEEPAPELEEGFAYLFDGRSLEGWRELGDSDQFDLSRGVIRASAHSAAAADLIGAQTYGNFVLRLELKLDASGAAGIVFRGQSDASDAVAAGYQLIFDTHSETTAVRLRDTRGRTLFDGPMAPESGAAALAADTWHKIEISVVASNIALKINEMEIFNVVDAVALNGFVGLHMPAASSGAAHWRYIRIQTLGAHHWNTEKLAELNAWQGIGAASLAASPRGIAIEGGADAILRSKRRFSDFALRFRVPLCKQPLWVLLRGDENDGGAVAALTDSAVTVALRQQDGGPVRVLGRLDRAAPALSAEVIITAVGNQLSVSVGGKQVVQTSELNWASRGIFQIQPAGCSASTLLSNIAWLDLTRDGAAPKFYETVDVPPAPVRTAADELATFKLPPGFRAELVAAEPLVGDPVAMDWDEDGRLYVVEMRGYMRDAYGSGSDKPVGRVVVLEDTDKDGRMDRGNVFLDGLVMPRAIAVVNEGVLIGEPPNLWLCPTGNRRICVEKRRVGNFASDYQASNAEHLENGLLTGLDNWLYNATSARRMRLEKGRMQSEKTAFRGQWGIAQDDWGRLYYNNNSTYLLGDYFPAEPLLREHVNLPDNSGISRQLTRAEEVFSIRVNPGVNRAYVDGTLREDGRLKLVTAVSGLTVMRGDAFPPPYAGNIFIPEPAANVVAQMRPVESGFDIRAEHITWPDEQWGEREFLASTDERFRPVDAKVGPDGALYIIDMYRGIIQDVAYMSDSLREQVFERGLDVPVGLGRIWRIVHDTKPVQPPPRMSRMRTAELVGEFNSGNGWRRDTAQRLLLKRQGGTKALQLRAWAADGVGAVHAIWTLAGRGELRARDVLNIVARNNPPVSVQAIRAGENQLSFADVQALLAGPAAEDPRLLRELILTLRFHHADTNTAGLVAALAAQLLTAPATAATPFLLNAVVAAARDYELRVIDQLAGYEISASEMAEQLYAELGRRAYLSLRPDITSEAPAPAALNALLLVAAAQPDWVQVAILKSLAPLRLQDGFVPALLDAAPAMFTDIAIAESDPLWAARLSARRAFTWPGDEVALGLEPLAPRQMAMMQKGEKFYTNCGSCHAADGRGVTGLAPPLAASEWVTGAPEWLARIILQGLTGPVSVNGQTYTGVMPPHHGHKGLDDETLAGLMTFIRRSWGNTAAVVEPEVVAAIRKASATRSTPWTVAELEKVPVDRGFGRYTGIYKVSFMKITVAEQDGDLVMKVPMYGSSALSALDEEHAFRVANGDKVAVLRFLVGDDGEVNQLRLKQGTNDLLAERVD